MKNYFIADVSGRTNNKLNREVYEELKSVLENSTLTIDPNEVYDNINEFVKRKCEKYPRCRQLSFRMTSNISMPGASFSVDDGTGNSVCCFYMREAKREIDDLESFLF